MRSAHGQRGQVPDDAHLDADLVRDVRVREPERREEERLADLTAAKYSGCSDGQVFFLKILDRHVKVEQITHPSFKDRIKYLSQFK